jgi:hypothetical protein
MLPEAGLEPTTFGLDLLIEIAHGSQVRPALPRRKSGERRSDRAAFVDERADASSERLALRRNRIALPSVWAAAYFARWRSGGCSASVDVQATEGRAARARRSEDAGPGYVLPSTSTRLAKEANMFIGISLVGLILLILLLVWIF